MCPNDEQPPPTSPLPTLPMDIIIYILCRLPVKTLLCIRSLSKQFRLLIDSPDFINRHLQYQSSNPKLIVCDNYENLQVLVPNKDSLHKALAMDDVPFIDWIYGDEVNDLIYCLKLHFFVDVIGSCDGLLALSNLNHDNVVLFNVSTRKHRILPKYLADPGFGSNPFMTTCGFGRVGYDDYKVVRIASSRTLQKTNVSIWSLKTETWRKVVELSPSQLNFNGMAALLHCNLNWLVCVNAIHEIHEGFENEPQFILSFDLETESLVSMSLPDEIGYMLYLTVREEWLCVVENIDSVYYHNIWVMKEYGVKESWTKIYFLSLYAFPFDVSTSFAFSFSKHGDKIFASVGYREVMVWDLEEGRQETVEALPWTPRCLCNFVESLVSP